MSVFKVKSLTSSNLVRSWIILGIPVLFIAGSLTHFMYDWSGNLTIVGIFSPVNESVWEHLKMAFWPMLIWWFAGYVLLWKRKKISFSQWFVSCAVAELVCLLAIMSFFYTYTGAIGIESVFFDILSFFFGIALGQIIALHIFNYAKITKNCLFFAIAILILLAFAFIIFTFVPPHIPLFKDASTGQYGI